MKKKPFYLYNTRSSKKEVFSPLKEEGQVSMYACGPTVYDYVHIGNLRTFLVEDLLLRFLSYLGYSVQYIMNFTDIDDKTLKRSRLEGKSLKDLTSFYERAFEKDIDRLKIQKASHYPRATEFVPQMISCIQLLIEKGYAYVSEDQSVYYSIEKFSNYGKLSHIHPEDLHPGASERVRADEYDKHDVGDFVLWKSRVPEDGEVFWDSPWGKGRPGWHIECSVMSHFYLGNSFDIHCGGIDNKFPHHENEIAQSVAAYGGEFSRWFVHVKHLKLADQKMSKSLGNIVTLDTLFQEGWRGDVIRYALLTSHYRQELIFSSSLLIQSKEALSRIRRFLKDLKEVDKEEKISIVSHETIKVLDSIKEKFYDSLGDDLNFPKTLGVIFGVIKSFYKGDLKILSFLDVTAVMDMLKDFDRVCGFIFPWEDLSAVLDQNTQKLLALREEARKNKDYRKADQIREEFLEQGFEILDSPEGPIVRKK